MTALKSVSNGDGGAGRRVFFVDVVALDDAGGVAVASSGDGDARDVEEQVYADGEVRRIDEADAGLLHKLANTRYLAVPARGGHDHVDARASARFDVVENGVGRGDVDGDVDAAGGGNGRPALVCGRRHDGDIVAALARDGVDE